MHNLPHGRAVLLFEMTGCSLYLSQGLKIWFWCLSLCLASKSKQRKLNFTVPSQGTELKRYDRRKCVLLELGTLRMESISNQTHKAGSCQLFGVCVKIFDKHHNLLVSCMKFLWFSQGQKMKNPQPPWLQGESF